MLITCQHCGKRVDTEESTNVVCPYCGQPAHRGVEKPIPAPGPPREGVRCQHCHKILLAHHLDKALCPYCRRPWQVHYKRPSLPIAQPVDYSPPTVPISSDVSKQPIPRPAPRPPSIEQIPPAPPRQGKINQEHDQSLPFLTVIPRSNRGLTIALCVGGPILFAAFLVGAWFVWISREPPGRASQLTVSELVNEVRHKRIEKVKFYAEYGIPERVAEGYHDCFLYYNCRDGVAKLSCASGLFINDEIMVLSGHRIY